MSDGLSDRRSQSTYKCATCQQDKYMDDFYDFSIRLCYSCHHNAKDITSPKEEKAMKFDSGKLQYSLIPPEIKLYLAEILTFGAKKYAPDNWKKIDVKRYYDAFERHMNAFQLGEENDSESGMHHLKHALTNMVFITWLELNKSKGK